MAIRFIALMSFLITQLVLLYFAGFLQSWTPKGVDTGPGGSVVLNLALLLAFGLVHSALARPAVKQKLYGAFNEKLSRSIYNLIASAQLALVMYWWTPLRDTLWQFESGIGAGIAYALFGLGLGLLFWAIFAIDAWHFFGLRQAFGDLRSAPQFVVRGPYRLVRHPIQTGLILSIWATPHMTTGHALLAVFLTFYSVLATLMLEERDLRAQLGSDYEQYRRRVPALLPRVFGRRDQT
jgi:protein-S-isoprenylcysteine O-methyltransferase Ste14